MGQNIIDTIQQFMNFKKHIISIFIVMGIAIGLIVLLAWVAVKPIDEKISFNRNLIPPGLEVLDISEKPKDVIDFAGVANNSVYFKTTKPGKIFFTDYLFQQKKYIDLNIPDDKALSSRFSCIVDSPDIYILGGNMPAIIKARQTDSMKLYKFPGAVFTRAALISSNSFALRKFEGLTQIFIKGDISSGNLIKEKELSNKSKDAGFSTDGSLHYDKKNSLLVYVQYYKSEVICFDTNLNIIRRINTIDLSQNALPETQQLKSKNIITSMSPKRMINYSNIVKGGILFNNSVIKADNESSGVFRSNSIIDVYDVNTGNFIKSFYIPKYKGQAISALAIVDDRIIGLYKNYIISYRVPHEIWELIKNA